LKGLEGSRWSWQPAEAGYFQVLDYSAFDQRDDRTVTRTWCELGIDHGIALIPLSPFYPTGLPAGHSSQRVRVCFAKNEATLDEGIDRLLRVSETILT
jgi:methionine aminotransferase